MGSDEGGNIFNKESCGEGILVGTLKGAEEGGKFCNKEVFGDGIVVGTTEGVSEGITVGSDKGVFFNKDSCDDGIVVGSVENLDGIMVENRGLLRPPICSCRVLCPTVKDPV